MEKKQHQLTLPGLALEDDQSDSDETSPFSSSSCKDAVYVLDTHYLMYQVFHALPDIRSPAGKPVAAIYGYVQDILQLMNRDDCGYLMCAFDTPLDASFRRKLYSAYKSNREAMPEELSDQVLSVRRMLTAMNVPALESAGYEADDVLATVANMSYAKGLTCYLVTGDKDCRQLLKDRVFIYNHRKDLIFDAHELHRTWGIRPDQVVDFQALVGDPVDNIPGVPLIGPKTASQLLNQYESLDNLLAHATEVRGDSRRRNLIEGRESTQLARDLVRLVEDVPIQLDWGSSRVGGMDQVRIQDLCDEFGLQRLSSRLAAFS